MKRSNLKSPYVGVYWDFARQAWKAEIQYTVHSQKKRHRLGYFYDDSVAARAYDEVVIAENLSRPLNFPESDGARAVSSSAPSVKAPKHPSIAVGTHVKVLGPSLGGAGVSVFVLVMKKRAWHMLRALGAPESVGCISARPSQVVLATKADVAAARAALASAATQANETEAEKKEESEATKVKMEEKKEENEAVQENRRVSEKITSVEMSEEVAEKVAEACAAAAVEDEDANDDDDLLRCGATVFVMMKNFVVRTATVLAVKEPTRGSSWVSVQVCFYLPLHFKRILLTILTCPPHILTF